MKTRVFSFALALLFASPTILYSQGTLWGINSTGGSSGGGSIFKVNYDGTVYTEVAEFPIVNPGSQPEVLPTLAGNGKMYGTTTSGGMYGRGVLYEYDPATYAYQKKYDFSLASGYSNSVGLTLGSNGKLYGTTWTGGANGRGTIYEFNPVTSTFTKIHDFASNLQCISKLTQASNGKLYGLTSNNSFTPTLFEFIPATGAFVIKHTFNGTIVGIRTVGSLIEANGKLYGTTGPYGGYTPAYGALFEYDYTTNTMTPRAIFNSNDGTPGIDMVLASNGNIYGIFNDTHPSGGPTAIYEFNPAALQYTKRLNFDTGVLPIGSICSGPGGKIYGVTITGGANNFGIIYEYDVSTNILIPKYNFSTQVPVKGVSYDPSGKLVGVSRWGGATNNGFIYDFVLSSSIFTKRVDILLLTTLGAYPSGTLIKANNGKIYGATGGGGANGSGTVFEITESTGALVKVLDMPYANQPAGVMVAGPNGYMYIPTNNGLYEFNHISNTLTLRHALVQGAQTAAVTFNGTSLLYTYYQTSSGFYSSQYSAYLYYNWIAISTGTYINNLPINFTRPAGPMIKMSGTSYLGITQNAIPGGASYIYEFNPSAPSFVNKKDLTTPNSIGFGTPVLSGTNLYFAASGPFSQNGAIYQFDPANNGTVITPYPGSIGFGGVGSLAISSNGKLYGISTAGGANGYGTLFEFDPVTLTYVKKVDLHSAHNKFGGLLYTKADQTIIFPPIATKTYGDPQFALTATASSGLAPTYTSTNTSVASVSGNTVTIAGAGTTTIIASQAGNASYNSAVDVPQLLTVNKAPLTVTASNAFKSYGAALPSFSVTYSGFVNGETESVLDAAPTISTNAVTCSGVGQYPITPCCGSDINYSITHQPSTLTVTKKMLDVTADNKTRAYGASNPPWTFYYNGLVCGDTPSVISLSASTTAVQFSNAGSAFPITPAGSQAANYEVRYFVGFLTITQATQTLNMVQVPPICGTYEVDLLSYFTSIAPYGPTGLTPSFSSSNPSIAPIVNGTKLKVLAPTTVTITATQAGNGNILPATQQQMIVTGDPHPVGVITQGGWICTGPVTLAAGQGSGYVWTPNPNGYTNPYIATSAGTYSVSYTTLEGCSVSDSEYVSDEGCSGGGGGGGGGCCIERQALSESDSESAEPFDLNYKLGVYPNPAQDEVRIVLSSTAENDCPVYFYDILGRLSKSVVIEKGLKSKSVSITDMQTGIYLVAITDNGRMRQRKLIVRRD